MSISAAHGEDRSGVPRLRRVLSVWDLILYGMVAVTPSAPATVFGLAELRSHGHAVVTILAAMVAMSRDTKPAPKVLAPAGQWGMVVNKEGGDEETHQSCNSAYCTRSHCGQRIARTRSQIGGYETVTWPWIRAANAPSGEHA